MAGSLLLHVSGDEPGQTDAGAALAPARRTVISKAARVRADGRICCRLRWAAAAAVTGRLTDVRQML